MNAPDADLIMLCDEYLEKHAAMLWMASSVLHCDEHFRRMTASILGLQHLRDQIAGLTPTTDAGWRARFQACIAVMGDTQSDNEDEAFVRSALLEFVASVP
jgi:hypothetical protein